MVKVANDVLVLKTIVGIPYNTSHTYIQIDFLSEREK